MSKDLKLSLDHIHIKNDHDGWASGAGDIYFKYSLDGGGDKYFGKTGQTGIHTGKSSPLNYDFEFDDVESALSINIGVWDSDPGSDDHLPEDLVEHFSAAENFGIGHHTWDTKDYKLTYTIFEEFS